MRDLPAPLAGVGLPEFEGVDLGRVVADCAEPALAFEAGLAAVEVLVEYLELALEVVPLVAVVDVVEVLEAEQVLLQAVVDLALEHVVHELAVADRVVHQVDLPPQDQELVQLAVALHHRVLVADLDDGLLVVALDALQPALGHVVAAEVELLARLVGDLDALLGGVVIAVPLAQVVAVVHVGAEEVEALAQWLLALEARGLAAARLGAAAVGEDLELVAELLVEEVLRVLQVPRLALQVQLGSRLDRCGSGELLRRKGDGGVGFGLGLGLLNRLPLLEQRFLLPELFLPLLLQLFLPDLLCPLGPQPLLQKVLLDLLDDRPQHLVDGHLQCKLLLPDLHQVGLKVLDVD